MERETHVANSRQPSSQYLMFLKRYYFNLQWETELSIILSFRQIFLGSHLWPAGYLVSRDSEPGSKLRHASASLLIVSTGRGALFPGRCWRPLPGAAALHPLVTGTSSPRVSTCSLVCLCVTCYFCLYPLFLTIWYSEDCLFSVLRGETPRCCPRFLPARTVTHCFLSGVCGNRCP